MTKIDQDFELYQGETKEVTVNTDDADGAANVMTGGSATFGAYRSLESPKPEVVLKKTGADVSFVDVDGTDDGIRFTLAPADSARLSGDYPFIVDGVDSAGDEAVVSTGIMKIKTNPNKA
ncbi:MAG: hypothetical protein ACC700_19840 [Anaerolineales bacterium]